MKPNLPINFTQLSPFSKQIPIQKKPEQENAKVPQNLITIPKIIYDDDDDDSDSDDLNVVQFIAKELAPCKLESNNLIPVKEEYIPFPQYQLKQQESNFKSNKKQEIFQRSEQKQESQRLRETKLDTVRNILKPHIQESQFSSFGGLISPEGETRASSAFHFEVKILVLILLIKIYISQKKEKKWNQSIIPLTCRILNKAIQNVNLRLEVEGQPIEQVELVGHVCNISYGQAYTMMGEQNFMAIDISDLTDVAQAIIYQPQGEKATENLIDYLKRVENWGSNPERMLTGVYVKVLLRPRYVVTEKKWKNTCSSISIIQDANEITKHYIDVIKGYLERKDGFSHRIKSSILNNPIMIQANQSNNGQGTNNLNNGESASKQTNNQENNN